MQNTVQLTRQSFLNICDFLRIAVFLPPGDLLPPEIASAPPDRIPLRPEPGTQGVSLYISASGSVEGPARIHKILVLPQPGAGFRTAVFQFDDAQVPVYRVLFPAACGECWEDPALDRVYVPAQDTARLLVDPPAPTWWDGVILYSEP